MFPSWEILGRQIWNTDSTSKICIVVYKNMYIQKMVYIKMVYGIYKKVVYTKNV